MKDFIVIHDNDPRYNVLQHQLFDDDIFKWLKIYNEAKKHPGLQELVEQVIIMYKLIESNDQIKPEQ